MLVGVSTGTARSADGTSLRTWCNDADGEPVLICNGLGTPPEAWPRIVAPDSGYRVVTWYQRGLGGSDRPADPARVRVADHAADARAVLDAFGLSSATLVGWSLGVNVAFELALEAPDRVRGVLAVAGVPGGTFSSLFAPYGVPRRVRAPLGRAASGLLPVLGPLLPLLAFSLPPWYDVLLPEAFRGPVEELAHPSALVATLEAFARHDWRWYRHLALGLAEHEPLDVSAVRRPVTFLAGRFDGLVDVADVRTAARTVPGARLRELAGTHFLPLQYPRVMVEELRLLTAR